MLKNCDQTTLSQIVVNCQVEWMIFEDLDELYYYSCRKQEIYFINYLEIYVELIMTAIT